MQTKEESLSLENIKDGAAVHLWGIELEKVLKNINDLNTDPEQKRTITLKAVFRPDEDRELGDIDLTVGSKLAGPRAVSTRVTFGKDARGRLEAREFLTRQPNMFENRNNVVSMGE